MLDSIYVEVAASLAVIFFLLAAGIAALNQWVTRLLAIRAKILWRALANALDPDQGTELDLSLPRLVRQAFGSDTPRIGDEATDLATRLANTSGVRSLGATAPGTHTRVDHIPGQVFARSLVAVAADADDPNLTGIKDALAGTVVGESIAGITDDAQYGIDRATAVIEEWFDGYMARLSELYRVSAQKILFVAGFGAAVVFNVNAVGLIDELADNHNARDALTGAIDICGPDDSAQACSDEVGARLAAADAAVDLPLVGTYQPPWDEWNEAADIPGRYQVVLGWLTTGFAVSFGAPFWFDTARRLSSLRRG